MAKVHTIVVDRRPTVKARPRVTKKGYAYTPKKTLEAEDIVSAAWAEQVGEIFSGPGEVTIRYSPTETILTVMESPHDAGVLKGDLDNYVKLTLDALNKVAWEDDKQVVRISAVKVDHDDKD